MTSGPGLYLCGCQPEGKIARYGGKRFEKGIEVCPEHSQPLYGYLSPQMEKPGLGRVIDFSRKGRGGTLNLDTRTEDRRNNQDPMRAYEARQHEKAVINAGSNGHH